MNTPCYLCRKRQAGHPANPVSAYCAECQPAAAAQPPGSFSACSRCGSVFGTLRAFDDHLVRDDSQVVIIACRPPADLGLVQDEHGSWQTPAGLADRARKRHQVAGFALARRGDGAQAP